MMSRRKALPSLSSSRQMMMAWNVSGLSHSPAIIASRPASMRLANRDFALAREEFHRAHFAQIHAHGIVGALDRLLGLGFGRNLLLNFDQFAAFGFRLLVQLHVLLLVVVGRLLGFD